MVQSTAEVAEVKCDQPSIRSPRAHYTPQEHDKAAEIKHKRNKLASELLLRRLRKYHYDHAPDTYKNAYLPAIPMPDPLLTAYFSFVEMSSPRGAEIAAGMKAAWAILNVEESDAHEIASPLMEGLNIRQIQRAVCRYYRVPRNDFVSRRREAHIVLARQVAIYLCKRLTTKSLPEIGRKFGGRDHTTALHSVRKITRLIQEGGKVATDVTILTAKIFSAISQPEEIICSTAASMVHEST